MSERCEICRFWKDAGCTVVGGYAAGHCKRHAPIAVQPPDRASRGEGVWPLVSVRDWCGDFSQRELSQQERIAEQARANWPDSYGQSSLMGHSRASDPFGFR